jgi:hypothetical protein
MLSCADRRSSARRRRGVERARREAGPAEPPQAGQRDLERNRAPGHPQVVDSALMSAAAPVSPQSGMRAQRAAPAGLTRAMTREPISTNNPDAAPAT